MDKRLKIWILLYINKKRIAQVTALYDESNKLLFDLNPEGLSFTDFLDKIFEIDREGLIKREEGRFGLTFGLTDKGKEYIDSIKYRDRKDISPYVPEISLELRIIEKEKFILFLIFFLFSGSIWYELFVFKIGWLLIVNLFIFILSFSVVANYILQGFFEWFIANVPRIGSKLYGAYKKQEKQLLYAFASLIGLLFILFLLYGPKDGIFGVSLNEFREGVIPGGLLSLVGGTILFLVSRAKNTKK